MEHDEKSKTFRNFKKKNCETFLQDLREKPWELINLKNDINSFIHFTIINNSLYVYKLQNNIIYICLSGIFRNF